MQTIRQNTVFDLVNRKTRPTVSTDREVTFHKPLFTPIRTKEQLGIQSSNLVLSGSAFPVDPEPGQVFVKDGVPYIYKEEE